MTLGAVCFLGRFVASPRLARVAFSREHLARLTPLGASLFAAPRARLALGLASLASRTPCFELDPGLPEETAELLARTMEG